MSDNQEHQNPYAILFAAITGTLPQDWSNIRHFSWDAGNIQDAPAMPRYGNDVFAIIVMDYKDGGTAQVCYDLQDYVYVDFGDIRWSGPLEDDVHSLATWELDFEGAAQARKDELARRDACIEYA